MANLWTLLLAIWAMTSLSQARTVQDIIKERPELVQLRNVMKDTPVYSILGQSNRQFTFFAPDNEAIRQLPRNVWTDLESNNDRGIQLLNYHLLPPDDQGTPYQLAELNDKRVETLANNAPKVFLRTQRVGTSEQHYINGARVLKGDIQASNGVVHIIGSFLNPLGEKDNAFSLIDSLSQITDRTRSTKIFRDLLQTVRYTKPVSTLNSDTFFVTAFVPSDKSIEKILTNQRKAELEANEDETLKLLGRHIIVHETTNGPVNMGVEGVWHGGVLNDFVENSLEKREPELSIKAMEGNIRPVRIANTLYVTNVCGMVKVMDVPDPYLREQKMEIDEMEREGDLPGSSSGFNPFQSSFSVFPNKTVNNGVVHVVDGLLGYIYTDIIGTLQEETRISEFRDSILMTTSVMDKLTIPNPDIVLNEAQKLTVFVPIDDAFTNIRNAGNIDLTQDDELRERVLNMHMVRGVVNLIDIRNTTVRQTEDVGTQMRFYTDRTGTYVMVDRVRARIVKADVCVKNGIMHFIDNLLGVPYRNLFDEISESDSLRSLYDAVEKTPTFSSVTYNRLSTITELLKNVDVKRTFFAPNNDAFNKMRQTAVGRSYMEARNADKLYYLILRHMPEGEFYIEDDNARDELRISSGLVVYKNPQGEYIVEYRSEYGSAKARILQRNLRLINGVLHVIDSVLFENSQAAFAAVGSAGLPQLSLSLAALLTSVYLLKHLF